MTLWKENITLVVFVLNKKVMGSAKSGQQKPDGSGKDLKKEKEREKLNTNHNYVMKPRSFVRKHNSYK